MGWDDKNRGRRAAGEAKALQKKMKRHGGELSSHEIARLQKVRGRVAKFGISDEDESDDYRHD